MCSAVGARGAGYKMQESLSVVSHSSLSIMLHSSLVWCTNMHNILNIGHSSNYIPILSIYTITHFYVPKTICKNL